MDWLRQYVFSVTAAAIFCAILSAMVQGKKAEKLMRLVSGMFLACVILKPLFGAKIQQWDLLGDWEEEASQAAQQGQAYAREAMGAIIKERTETYIQDKAAELGGTLEAEVLLSEDPVPVPMGAKLRGEMEASARQQLEQWMEEALGITKECLTWMDLPGVSG